MTDYVAREANPKVNPPISSCSAGEIRAMQGEITLDDALAADDTIRLGLVPEGHVPVDVVLDTDSLDSGSGIALDVGDLDGDGDELIADSTVGQGGGMARMDQAGGTRLSPASDGPMKIGATVTSGPGTPVTPATVTATVYYRRSRRGS